MQSQASQSNTECGRKQTRSYVENAGVTAKVNIRFVFSKLFMIATWIFITDPDLADLAEPSLMKIYWNIVMDTVYMIMSSSLIGE